MPSCARGGGVVPFVCPLVLQLAYHQLTPPALPAGVGAADGRHVGDAVVRYCHLTEKHPVLLVFSTAPRARQGRRQQCAAEHAPLPLQTQQGAAWWFGQPLYAKQPNKRNQNNKGK